MSSTEPTSSGSTDTPKPSTSGGESSVGQPSKNTGHSLPGPSTAYSCNCGKARNQRSHTHSTISSTVRKELASYENPYQPLPPVKVVSAKRNASTESLDLLSGSKDECTCAIYSPNSIDGTSCKKCKRDFSASDAQRAQKKYNSSKYKDASTSPKSNSPLRTLEPKSPRSPKSPCAEASTDTKFDFPCSPKTENHYKRLSTLSINSGNKNAGTSPIKQQPSPKMSPNKLAPVRSDRVLEKSNSLGESKPQKQLRTTRSLSPRPPVKHQHSIMVSDENDIVSVKLSPNEEFDEGREKEKHQEMDEADSEVTSPILSDCATLQLDDGNLTPANNRSTSCLVYVPSDPWTRMSGRISPIPAIKNKHKAKTLESKSFSKPNLEYFEDTDPWVWRSNINLNERYMKKKGSLPNHSKSLSSAHSRDELLESRQMRLCQQRSLTKFDKNLTIPGIDLHFDARKKITRPKLQRSKSPAFYEEFFQTEKEKALSKNKSVSSLKIEKNASNCNINGAKCTCTDVNSLNRASNNQPKCEHVYKSTTSITSPTTKKQPSPKLNIPKSPKTKPQQSNNQPELVKASLTVLNPNLLQPRHSFSTPSQKDDELQLNIRRLSEQMNKYNSIGTGYFTQAPSPSFMNDTIPLEKKKSSGSGGLISTAGSTGTAQPQKRASSHSKINEPILETRC
ncbi:uncharacterized protein LOC131694968 [Topomyia yanbarensis]|uniref:uncharacterized protein LOC131694968 n=1 Tax=Topomyia yanbarensis TaxID=2498891 RepID=UPI00273C6EB3|nr:uncharacterized protein LOC131694968 [Topomyia yanbarensis]